MSPTTKVSTGGALFIILGLIRDALEEGVLADYPPQFTTIAIAILSLVGMYYMPERNPAQSARDVAEADLVEYFRDVEEDERRRDAQELAAAYQNNQWQETAANQQQWQQPAPGGEPPWQSPGQALERPGERQVRQQRGDYGYPMG